MSRVLWNAEHGWHETEDDYRLTLLTNGAIRWIKVEADADTRQSQTRRGYTLDELFPPYDLRPRHGVVRG